jgi:hypothetical protein|tara:strand:- start:6809 stop:7453 length:645 start_codon:yes stop_codon:yes gene_type:complete
MAESINYDDMCLKDFNSNNLLYNKFNLNNIKFLESPVEIKKDDNSYTLIKIICTKKIKVFLKNIERILNNDNDNDIIVRINYNIEKNTDYYELLINKKISELLDDNFNINEYYNILVSLTDKLILWKIHSIEINDDNKLINNDLEENDLLVDEFDPDYEELLKSLKKEIKLIIKKMDFDLCDLNNKKNELENIINNMDFNKLGDYRNLLNSYSN